MMKKYYTILLLQSLCLIISAQSDYYWYRGNKSPVTKIQGKKYVLFEKSTNISAVLDIIPLKGIISSQSDTFNFSKSTIPFENRQLTSKIWAILDHNSISNISFADLDQVIYSSDFYKTKYGNIVGLSHLFYVRLKDSKDISILETLAKKNNIDIIGNNIFMPLWYTLSCTKESTGDALQMANTFYESGLFQAATPDFMQQTTAYCSEDPYYVDQWGLNNTGQYGSIYHDINYKEASLITSGSEEIIIAIIDCGFELDHPDLVNVHDFSWDSWTGTSPSVVRNYFHGTACAGIIGAGADNGEGISGIAPDCKIMSISGILTNYPDLGVRMADGISKAWREGASVISCSWHLVFEDDRFFEAIDSAITYGRNGRGSVVVFSAGNTDSYVSYPANCNDDIIVAGAVSPCGERKTTESCDGENWASNFGSKLDIMAPGVLIPTTDLQGNSGINTRHALHPDMGGTLVADDYSETTDYTIWFTGTSAACPHVAAVAGLILSLDPTLTQHEVADIIESTAQKVGGYEYGTNATRPNGTWNTYMGYGLLDAHAAVLEACLTTEFFDQIIVHNTTIEGCNIDIQNVEVKNNSNFTIEAGNEVTIIGDFEVELGSELEIY